jgi:hypothetical protein
MALRYTTEIISDITQPFNTSILIALMTRRTRHRRRHHPVGLFSLNELRQGINFTNILRAAFSYESFAQSFFCSYILGLNFFWQKNIGANAYRKCW